MLRTALDACLHHAAETSLPANAADANWLERERGFYQRVMAEDSDQAEPALRLLAEEARALLPYSASVRRLLLVASGGLGGPSRRV